MRSIALLPVTLCLLAGVAGCGSSSGSDSGGDAGDPDVVYLRGLNAVSNGPDLRLSVDGIALDDVEYGAATALQRRSLGSGTTAVLNVQARALAPGGIGLPLADAAVSVNGDTEVALIVTGEFPAAEGIAVPAPRRRKPVGGLYFQFAHAASAAGALDVYLTDPAVDLTDELPNAGELPPAADIVRRDLRYGQMSDYLGLATGTSYLTLTERFYGTDAEAPDATESITIGPLPFEALGGEVATLLILPGQTGATEDMLLLDDLVP